MTKVITYGTFDLLHRGHIRLLERAKALGDYLIVGVTSDDFDRTRGKINNQQTLMERIAAVRSTGIADEVIVEEYEGQKIDDIRRYEADIFTVGSDWEGKFDYLREYCRVIYLPRTEGISSTELRAERHRLRIGLIGETKSELTSLRKFVREAAFVNGVEIVCASGPLGALPCAESSEALFERVDAVYIASHPARHYADCRAALEHGRHVLCESPLALSRAECRALFELAEARGLILMEGIKTAYTTAYERLTLLAKTGRIGKVLSVDATCTSKKELAAYSEEELALNWNTITEWGPPALLPIFQILGPHYRQAHMVTKPFRGRRDFDEFTKLELLYDEAVASMKVAKGAKSEGELVITGTDAYIYVPSPWWKTDYFEIRNERPSENRRYFYQLDGEGIRYEIVAFARSVETGRRCHNIEGEISEAIGGVMELFYGQTGVSYI